MQDKYRLDPGPLASGQLKIASLAAGALLMVVAAVLLFVWHERGLHIVLASLLLSVIGLMFLSYGIMRNGVKNIYCLNGRYCKIIEGTYQCSGGCNRCVFAYRYLETVNSVPAGLRESVDIKTKAGSTVSDQSGAFKKDDSSNEQKDRNTSSFAVDSRQTSDFESGHPLMGTAVVSSGYDPDEIIGRYGGLRDIDVTKDNVSRFDEAVQELSSAKSVKGDRQQDIVSLYYDLSRKRSEYEEEEGLTRYRTIIFNADSTQDDPLFVRVSTNGAMVSRTVVVSDRVRVRPKGNVSTVEIRWRSGQESHKRIVKSKVGLFPTSRTIEEPDWNVRTFTENINWPDTICFEFKKEGHRYVLIHSDLDDFKFS